MSGGERTFAELVATLRAESGTSPLGSLSPGVGREEVALDELLARRSDGAVGARGAGGRSGAEAIASLYDSRWPAAAPAPGPQVVTALQPASPQLARPRSPPGSPAVSAATQSAHTTGTASSSDEFVRGLVERAAVRPARESLGQLEQRIRTSSVPGPSVPSPVTSLHSRSITPLPMAEATPPDPLPVGAVAVGTTGCVTRTGQAVLLTLTC
jgi:hypothetical protein